MPTITEDREAIRDVLARYCFYQDTGRIDDWVTLFTEDGSFDIGGGEIVKGWAALKAFGDGIPTGSMHHMVTDHVIELDGDTATCDTSVIVIAKGAIMMTAHAHDELKRVGGAWHIHRRSYTPDPQ